MFGDRFIHNGRKCVPVETRRRFLQPRRLGGRRALLFKGHVAVVGAVLRSRGGDEISAGWMGLVIVPQLAVDPSQDVEAQSRHTSHVDKDVQALCRIHSSCASHDAIRREHVVHVFLDILVESSVSNTCCCAMIKLVECTRADRNQTQTLLCLPFVNEDKSFSTTH